MIAIYAAMIFSDDATARIRAVKLLILSLGSLDLANIAFVAKVIILRHF